jgi:hypothetical protein
MYMVPVGQGRGWFLAAVDKTGSAISDDLRVPGLLYPFAEKKDP